MNKTSNSYFPLLDGLRGLAILLILIRHCIESDNYIIEFISSKCWVGVDIFFALSGFLISNILIRDRGKLKYFQRFYIRRILRIFPLYYFSLFIIFGITLYFRIDNNYVLIEDALYFFTYTHNFRFAFSTENSGHIIIYHYWSLAVEEHYYLVWPILIHFLKGKYLFNTCIVIIVSCTILRFYFPSSVNYVSTFTRLDALAAGSAIAWIYNSNRLNFKLLPIISIFSLVCLCYIMAVKPIYFLPFKLTFVGVLSACLVAYCIIDSNFRTILNYLLNNKPMRLLGKYSYGLYVFHFPVYIYFYKVVDDHTFLSMIGFFLVLSIIVFISYKYLESPFLKLKSKLVPYN